jgi:hypothetical protein
MHRCIMADQIVVAAACEPTVSGEIPSGAFRATLTVTVRSGVRFPRVVARYAISAQAKLVGRRDIGQLQHAIAEIDRRPGRLGLG